MIERKERHAMSERAMSELLRSGPVDADVCLVLAHGAGAQMTSPYMELMAGLLAERQIAVVRFEFQYMAARRAGGKPRPPPKAELLQDEYLAVVEKVAKDAPQGQRLVVGGKSLGGRVASLIADRAWKGGRIDGLVCLGYPFHPPGQPQKPRTAHLMEMVCPALIVQGERDPFGPRDEVEAFGLPPTIQVCWIGDGDHDFGPRGGSGFTRKGNLTVAADAVAHFVANLQSGD